MLLYRDVVIRLSRLLGWGLVALYVLAHLLLLIALVVFGLRAGGWVAPPVATAWYGLFVLGSAVLLVRARHPEETRWLVVLPMALALAFIGALGTRGLVGRAVYGFYDPGDIFRAWGVFQIGTALALVALAALYRWPTLLPAGFLAQAGMILTIPEEWATLLRYGWPHALATLFPALVLLYALAAWVLRLGPPVRWKTIIRIGAGCALLGAVVIMVVRYTVVLGDRRGVTVLPTLLGAFLLGGIGVPAVFVAARARKEAAGAGRRFPAEMVALSLLAASSLTFSLWSDLPRPGEPLPWVSPDTVVPDAWPPTREWAGGLLWILLWATVPLALLGLLTALPARRVQWALPDAAHLLMGAGIGLMALFVWELFPLTSPVLSLSPNLTFPEWLLSGPVGVLLVLAGRAMTAHPAASWEDKLRPLGRAAALGLLLFGLGYAALRGEEYLRAMGLVPPPGANLPAPLPLLAALGGLLYLLLLAFLVLAAGRCLTTWWRTDRAAGRRTLRNRLLSTLATLMVILGGAAWAVHPAVLQTVPPNGARDVPPDTYIQIRMRPSWLLMLTDLGTRFFARYLDTGQYIYGAVSFWGEGIFTLHPDPPLRPGAPVEVVVRWGWKRPYRLRFTTAGEGSPTATPIPFPTGPTEPTPTALPSPLPTLPSPPEGSFVHPKEKRARHFGSAWHVQERP